MEWLTGLFQSEWVTTISSVITSVDLWLAALAGVLVALTAVANITKTDKDNKAIAKAMNAVAKLQSLLSKVKKPKAVENTTLKAKGSKAQKK